MSIIDALSRWKAWSVTADRSEAGWESDYPQWGVLMDAARAAMLAPNHDAREISALAECWALAEEDEELLEFARQNLDRCWSALERLAESESPETRWQVYEALATAGLRGEGMLRRGLLDPDAYARRRALLALARHAPNDAVDLAERYLNEPDPYLRLAAVEMAAASPDREGRARILATLAADDVDFVERAAKEKLSA